MSLSSGSLLLGLDTCGAVGSIALGRVGDGEVAVLRDSLVPGGELSVLLLQAVVDLLAEAGLASADIAGIVAVAGPGSFTGIRIGLAVVKGMAEALGIPVVTVSRLQLLSSIAGTPTAVLDAHRGQMYCGMFGENSQEILLTAGEVNAMGGLPGPVGVCEEAVAQTLEELVGEPAIVRVNAPSAGDVLRFGLSDWLAGEFADVAALDGYYLRGADAKLAVGRA